MAYQVTSSNQVLHDQLEKAKETLGRLRCINGFTTTNCVTSQTGHGCTRHSHDVTVGKCVERHGENSREFSSKAWKGEGLKDATKTGTYSRFSRVDLQRIHKQIDSLEESIREPILRYVESMEEQNLDMIDAIEEIRRQLSKHERVCPAMNISSESVRNGSGGFVSKATESESVYVKLCASQKTEKESRDRAQSLVKEVEVYREKLERSEARVKELFWNTSQKKPSTPATSNEVFLENQLCRQKQLTEAYFKDSTTKDKELGFLTIEKYNLESEVNSLVTDLESSNRKRDELSQEKKGFESNVVEYRQSVTSLQQQLNESTVENKRLTSQFRDVLNEERTREEKMSENQNLQEKEIKGLRKKFKKFQEYRSSQDDVAKQLEAERDEVLARARNLSNEYKIKLSECNSLREENQRLTKEISSVQIEASLSKTGYSNSKKCVESLKCEVEEAKSVVSVLQDSLKDSQVNELKSSSELAVFNDKEASLRIRTEAVERERLGIVEELRETKGREVALRDEMTRMKENVETSLGEIKHLSQHCSSLVTDIELSKEKYIEVKKTNDELVWNKNEAERHQESTNSEITRLRDNHGELSEKNSQLSADLKAYKRIVVEKENQLKTVELQLTRLHKAKDVDLKELLKKDREIAFLKARVTSVRGGSSIGAPISGGLAGGENEFGTVSKDIEIYLGRIVELENECKAQKVQHDELQKHQYQAKRDHERSDILKQELASQDEEIQRLKREVARSKQVTEDLRDREGQLRILVDEKENLRQEVVRLKSKVEQVSELKQVCEQKEEEMRTLRRASSEEIDLEGKVARLKDRCLEKDEEIEELHQKVIALQVKIKDFMQQNLQVEEQMRTVKEKHSIELSEKEKISQALKTTETKYRSLQGDLEMVQSRNETVEKELVQAKRQVDTLGSEREESAQKIEDLVMVNTKKEEEVGELRKQVEDLENAKIGKENMEATSEDIPDGASTPLSGSLESSRLCFSRNGRTSAYDGRLEALEEENIQLLNRQSELEEELDAAEQHAHELKNALKSKRDTVNELHAEVDGLKEQLKGVEKGRDEMTEENDILQREYLLSQQKIEDLRAANERYMNEADELEKALTAAEKNIEELEKKIEDVSGKSANSEGQLQSVTERLARKDQELEVVEAHIDEQRKLCDGYKTSAEKQETLIEKLRMEKVSAEETFLEMKLEVAKKEGTYKAGKEKLSELQTRLYETEDRCSSKTNECKKLSRDYERLKRDMKELENKLSEQQSLMKKRLAAEAKDASSGVYKFLSLNTAVKDNSQNVEGLDSKLNSAQNKISTLEVELANDLRRISLHRSASDSSRRGYSENDNQLGIGSRPRSRSNVTTDGRESLGSISPLPRAGSVSSFDGEEDSEEIKIDELDFNIPSVRINHVDESHEKNFSETSVFKNVREDGASFQPSGVNGALIEADPFLARTGGSFATSTHHSERTQQLFTSEASESFISEASSIFLSTSLESQLGESHPGESQAMESQPVEPEVGLHVHEIITTQSAVVTGNDVTSNSQENWNEGLIYF